MKKLAVITGASSGIGEATARKLSAEGHPLLLIARRLDRLQALNLPNCICAQVDVTDYAAMKQAITDAEAKFGPADVIVNNAGVMLLGQLDTQDPAEWQQMVNVNIMGVMNGIQAVLSGMKARNTGTIINVSSLAGRKTFPNHAAYCGTKFAVHALTENTREEVASSNVRMVTIAPGAVETELLSHTTSQQIKDDYAAWKEAMGSIVASEDVADAIHFAYAMPQSVCVREIVMAPTKQPL